MTRLSLSIEISASPAEVYDFVSRPARWQEWQQASTGVHELGVLDVSPDSLVAGRRFEGDVTAAGRSFHLTWLVEESRPGQYWRASAYLADGSTVKMLYEFKSIAGGTHFTRTLDYVFEPLFLRILDLIYIQGKVRRESELALQNLRHYFLK